MPSLLTWWVAIRHLRCVPHWARREENLSTDVKTRDSYFLRSAITNILMFPKITFHLWHLFKYHLQNKYIHMVCYHTAHHRCSLYYSIPETRVSWETSISVFLTCSCSWPGVGSSFSLDTASALCSAWLGEVSISRPRACPWELVRTRLLLQRLPIGGVQSWKEEGRSSGTRWWWWSWMGSCQLCC